MESRSLLVVMTLLASASNVLGYDPDPLQDFCVAAPESDVVVNGFICKDPKFVNSSDFVYRANMHLKGNTSNPTGLAINMAFVNQFPALNTLGVSLIRVDFAPNGGSSPHTHPRASELILVLEGSILAGFVTSSPGNKLYSAVLNPGDLIIIPKGLIHFVYNNGPKPAVAIIAFGSQAPGLVSVSNAVFGSDPWIQQDILEKAFQVNSQVIDQLHAPFATHG